MQYRSGPDFSLVSVLVVLKSFWGDLGSVFTISHSSSFMNELTSSGCYRVYHNWSCLRQSCRVGSLRALNEILVNEFLVIMNKSRRFYYNQSMFTRLSVLCQILRLNQVIFFIQRQIWQSVLLFFDMAKRQKELTFNR